MHEAPLAIVTGAARGLGAACAQVLSADGFALCLLDRDAEGLERTAAGIAAAGGEAQTMAVDLLDEAAVLRAIAEHPERRRLRALVNAAGLISLGTVNDITVEDWDRILGVKLRGAFLTCKAAIPVMAENGCGAIVNIASMSGRTKSVLTAPNYAASNAGIIGLTMTLAAQHARQKIRVNAVAPGLIDTPMLNAYRADQLDAMRNMVPIGRFADPGEIAAVVSFLISDKASYVTGETINANGGMFMV